ncbi:hypothetical protein BJ138DRAFT_534555 [Hygrophoropsis aurantiaca]|uniref:Uncharacterized protein n=1 Tax=Hygrophoropsis aurantiaca TaxID=72124 RepID=A0ACB8A119_9AGAM|nr:hypothetical protein BJ138DRAFT_534555 [Hygrophoropsis aurantiaca]
MAATARQPKAPRKGMPETVRRPPAWSTNARASPTYSPANSTIRLPSGPPPTNQGGFPPLGGQTNGTRPQDAAQDRNIQSLSGLTGTTITLSTKTEQRYEGVIASTNSEGGVIGVTLKDVREINKPGAPLKDTIFIAATNIASWQSGPADAKVPNGDSFRTDTDISGKAQSGRERELQAWSEDVPGSPPPTTTNHDEIGDELTFGPSTGAKIPWDQFTANEKMFGVTTSFDEDAYTTKLDRSAADYKERERKAQRIASEILGGTTTNSHIAEERGLDVDDSGINEEDKYGAVVRGTNAYVPPGARKQNSTGSVASPSPKPEIPKVSINGPDGTPVVTKEPSPPSVKAPSPAPSSSSSTKPPADPLPAFRDFVTNERQRLTQKKQALFKSEMDKRKAELLKFSQSFKLNKPIPDDLVPILAKDEDKQRQIREKSTQDAQSSQARAIGVSSTLTPSPSATRMPQPPVSAKLVPEVIRKAAPPTVVASKTPSPASSASAAKAPAMKPASKPEGKPSSSMFIQVIPPFKGPKSRSAAAAPSALPQTNGSTSTTTATGSSPAPTSPTTLANRLNVNASSFRPNPKNPTSPIPSNASASASASPKPKSTEASAPAPNPFFGTKVIKKGAVHVKDDFNPFKHNKVAEASAITALWPFNGKRYNQMFPALQHQPQPPPAHIAPPGPPPVAHPVYEEGEPHRYVYYAPYYPGQPMMPGMPPPPPGAYVSSPYMQPMPYPPGMPPNGQPMYAASPMPQMPPPQYMPQPPHGAYPPPPNGAVPRASMPPTPIPGHAHQYYHQSPQMQHAVPYPMMMPPPGGPNGPPHPYEAGPAPPMGGVSHA